MRKKIRTAIITTVALFLMLCLAVGAWLAESIRSVDTGTVKVDIPPILYIRNNMANQDDNLQVLSLEELSIGQTTYIVFCVIPREDGIVTGYDLQIAYTNNMNETINLYEVTSLSATEGDVLYGNMYYSHSAGVISPTSTEESGYDSLYDIPYDGIYQRYNDRSFDTLTTLGITNVAFPALYANVTMGDETHHSQIDLYILEITWEEGHTIGIDDKETDLIYVYVQAS